MRLSTFCGLHRDKEQYIYICIPISIYRYLYLNIHFYAAVLNGKRKPRQFSLSVYSLLIVQMEVCGLSVCLQSNIRKLFVCKQTKRTCPSMVRSKYRRITRTEKVPFSECEGGGGDMGLDQNMALNLASIKLI